jgi:SAM-dependent methyltransferase
MTTPPDPTSHALSFAGVADAYERSRPGYPEEAVAWLVGGDDGHDRKPQRVVELGAGTGKLTGSLVAKDRAVLATDPLDPMLTHLVRNVPDALVVRSTAEQIPVRRRWADVVVVAQAYHWFDRERALPEIARALRPGGRIALTWNFRDERIPWVKRLGRIIGTQDQDTDPTLELLATGLFGFVEQAQFRFWQPLDRDRLHDLVTSRSNVATLDEAERQRVLADVDALYDDYGRGADGMLLPYVTHCFRAVARAQADPDDEHDDPEGPIDPPTDDDDADLLIDFR